MTLELLAQALVDAGVACRRPSADRVCTYWLESGPETAVLAAVAAEPGDAGHEVTWRVRRDAVLATAVLPVPGAVSFVAAAAAAECWNRSEPWPFLAADVAAQCIVARGTIPCYGGATSAELGLSALALARMTAAALHYCREASA